MKLKNNIQSLIEQKDAYFKEIKSNFKIRNQVGILVIVLIIISFTSCSIITHVTTSVDLQTDFSKYKTFAWLPDKTDTNNFINNNEIVRNNIKNYFGQSFAERGLTVNLDTPDVLLNLVVQSTKKETTVYYSNPPYPYYYRRYYYGSHYYYPYRFDYYYHHHHNYIYPFDYYYSQTYEYVENSITLNVIDRKLNKLIWSGTARKDIYDPSYINRNIHPSVEAIMNKYPVKKITNK